MLNRSLCVASKAFLVIGLLSQSAHATVTLNVGGVTTLTVQARDTSISPDNQTENLFPVSLPYNASHVATIGNSNSQAEYDLGQDGFQIFDVGGADGNVTNESSGSATGMLTAGHRYSVFYGTSIHAANTGGPASFTGVFELAFVPEPSSVALLGMGGLAMLDGVIRRRRFELLSR